MNKFNSTTSLVCTQIIALVAFLLSLTGWWLAWVAGLVAVVMLWIACCIEYPRWPFIVIAICSIIAMVGEILELSGIVDDDNLLGINIGGSTMMSIIAIFLWLLVAVVAFRTQYGGKTASDLPH